MGEFLQTECLQCIRRLAGGKPSYSLIPIDLIRKISPIVDNQNKSQETNFCHNACFDNSKVKKKKHDPDTIVLIIAVIMRFFSFLFYDLFRATKQRMN